MSPGDPENIRAVTEHVQRRLGPVSRVLHELKSDLVHLDVLVVEPTRNRPFVTLVTCGMSEAPMRCDCGQNHLFWAELMIRLPPDWPLDERSLRSERSFWPIRWLRDLARLPHEYDTLLDFGHSIPNGEPPRPLASNTRFTGFLVTNRGSTTLHVSPDKSIVFHTIEPLYPEEMLFKLMVGAEDLLLRFELLGITGVVDVKRPSACPDIRPNRRARRAAART